MTDKRVAVVTGANKGIGFETCGKLASNGITVILTARNEKNGTEAVKKLKASGLSNVVFHPLDVGDPASITSLAKFVKTNYKKLDILVNNAGQSGIVITLELMATFLEELRMINNAGQNGTEVNMEVIQDEAGVLQLSDENADKLEEVTINTYEMAADCLSTNYYGTKNVTEALLPLLELSKSARIVNVTSFLGQLLFIYNEKVKDVLSDVDNLSEEKIEEIVQWFLKDFKEGKLKANGWPQTASAYKVSKAAMNAYTKIMARKYPNILINCVHPGYVQTDITNGTGPLTPEEGARAPVMVALLPHNGPSGRYFQEMQEAAY